MIDAGLAAHGRVHLRQQRRRRVDQADTPQVRRGGESSQIAHHPTAERDQRVAALGALLDQPIPNPADCLDRFVGFKARYGQHRGGAQDGVQSAGMEVHRVLVGDDKQAPLEADAGECARKLRQRPRPRQQRNVAAAGAQPPRSNSLSLWERVGVRVRCQLVRHPHPRCRAASPRGRGGTGLWCARCQASHRRRSSPTSS